MIDKNYVAAAFIDHFEKITKIIEFDKKYHNGTGYLDNAVHIPLKQGETAKMIDDARRKCILVGTLFGTVIVFQRYSDNLDKIVCNFPQGLSEFGFHIGGTHLVNEADIHHLFGTCESNIGEKIKKLLESARVRKYVNDLNHAVVHDE